VDSDEHAQEVQSEDVLGAAFQFERLRAYASDDETWGAIDALASEVRATWRAVAVLEGSSSPRGSASRGGSASSTAGVKFPEERAAGGVRAGGQRRALGVL
jgi:hypothetical protein